MRLLVTVALVAVVPGWAIVHRIPLDDPLERAVLSVTVSLTVATAVTAALMYAGWWSPARAVAALVVITLVAAATERRDVSC